MVVYLFAASVRWFICCCCSVRWICCCCSNPVVYLLLLLHLVVLLVFGVSPPSGGVSCFVEFVDVSISLLICSWCFWCCAITSWLLWICWCSIRGVSGVGASGVVGGFVDAPSTVAASSAPPIKSNSYLSSSLEKILIIH